MQINCSVWPVMVAAVAALWLIHCLPPWLSLPLYLGLIFSPMFLRRPRHHHPPNKTRRRE